MKYIPTWVSESIYTLDLDFLKSQNIKYILVDLDNTLAPYNIPIPDERTKEFIKVVKEHGFEFIIVSNNTGKRVQLYASELDVKYLSGALKPFTKNIRKYLQENNMNIDDCVLVGDQLMTDIKCACKLGCKCILTKPLSKDEALVTFINRKIDQLYRKKYDLENKIKKIDRR